MEISLLRSTSTGIEGTYKNADHHAQLLKPLIKQLAVLIPFMDLAKWKQGNNVHVLVTHCGRQIVLRPHIEDNIQEFPSISYRNYIGIRASIRTSRTNEIVLSTVYFDKRNGVSVVEFAQMIQAVSVKVVPTLSVAKELQN